MRILVCNDDGIDAPGIITLAKALSSIGEVIVAAPNTQKSAAGSSCTLGVAFKVEEVTIGDHIKGYKIWGSPRDCADLACLKLLDPKPDLIVSGINNGCNNASDMVCSGTIGAALVGLLYGIPSIAMSLDFGPVLDYSYAGKVAVEVAKWFIQQPFNKEFVLNVNVPNIPVDQIKGYHTVGYGGLAYYDVQYSVTKDEHYTYYMPTDKRVTVIDETLDGDMYALANGYITLEPVHFDFVQYQHMSKLDNLVQQRKPE